MFPNFDVTIYLEKIEFSYTEINLNMPPEADNILSNIENAVICLKNYNLTSSEFIYATDFEAANFTLETDTNSICKCTKTDVKAQCYSDFTSLIITDMDNIVVLVQMYY